MDDAGGVAVESWGPTVAACLEEAVRGVVERFVDPSGIPASDTLAVSIERGSREDLLVDLVEEVIHLLGVLGVVPVGVEIQQAEDGGLAGTFEVVPAGRVAEIGPVPKGVSRSDLDVRQGPDGLWWASVTVGV